MTGTLTLHTVGPAVTVQDLGRPGHRPEGLSLGGAADRMALFEAAALLDAQQALPALEMAGMGGTFSVSAPTRVALTGAPMQATLHGQPLGWNGTHVVLPGQPLRIGGALAGTYGYLTFGGGLGLKPWLGSISTHLAAGLGACLAAGATLPLGRDPDLDAAPMVLRPEARFDGGSLCIMPGPQTNLFPEHDRARLAATPFTRAVQANRQGMRLAFDGAPFIARRTSGLASDFVEPGDVQMTGEGHPYILNCECQTMGGYPRIGTILPEDLPRVAQAPVGAPLRLEWTDWPAADTAARSDAQHLAEARRRLSPLVRDPHQMHDLLSYQLVSGATAGDDL